MHLRVTAIRGPALFVATLAAALAACSGSTVREYAPALGDSPATAAPVEYAFGVFPLHNPIRLYQVYQPALDLVNESAAGFSLRVEAGRDYPSYEAKLRARSLAFAIVNPYQALEAEQLGYRIVAKMGDDDRMRGIIVVRRDSGIERVEDLRGGAISFPAPTALAAAMMNEVFLVRHGVDVRKEAELRYVGSQDSAVMNVFLGLTRAGGTWPATWEALRRERPNVASALEVKWRTESLPSLAVIVRDDVPVDHVRSVVSVLEHLHESGRGSAILAKMEIARFERADVRTYDPVRTFLADYRRLFGASPPLQ